MSLPFPKCEGYVKKYINLVKGWQNRFFSLESGVLVYFETYDSPSCRGSINLKNAVISISTDVDGFRFSVDDSKQVIHMKTNTMEERTRWITALQKTRSVLDYMSNSTDSPTANENDDSTTTNSRSEAAAWEMPSRLQSVGVQRDALLKECQELKRLVDNLDITIKHDLNNNSSSNSNANLKKHSISESNSNNNDGSGTRMLMNSILEKSDKVELATKTLLQAVLSLSDGYHVEEENYKTIIREGDKERERLNALVRALRRGRTEDNNNSITINNNTKNSNISNNNDRKHNFDEDEDEDNCFFDASDNHHSNVNNININNINNNNNNNNNSRSSSSNSNRDTPPSRYSPPTTSTSPSISPITNAKTLKSKSSSSSSLISSSRPPLPSGSVPAITSATVTTITIPASKTRQLSLSQLQSFSKSSSTSQSDFIQSDGRIILNPESFVRRTKLPKDQANPKDVSLWSLLKDAVGKDLSRITIPVVFCEPLSMLQRMFEDLEYSPLLDKAFVTKDPFMRLAYIAAFAISPYSSTIGRNYKPFNPLLGETYEAVRPDRGFRFIAEQVCHHPPIGASYAESLEGRWSMNWDSPLKTKFWGKSIEVIPCGRVHLTLDDCLFSWDKVTTCVHNVIVGNKWVDHYGEMKIMNHTTGDYCILNLQAANTSWFSQPVRGMAGNSVSGQVFSSVDGKEKLKLKGCWSEYLEVVDHNNSGNNFLIWRKLPHPPNADAQYNFTYFSLGLNEFDENCKNLAPTDTRYRPDQRALENGDINLASSEKTRLEDKQRMKKSIHPSGSSSSSGNNNNSNNSSNSEKQPLQSAVGGDHDPEPTYFEKIYHNETNVNYYMYKGNYFGIKQAGAFDDPDIF